MPTHAGPNTAGDSNLLFAVDAADKKNSMLPFSTFLNMSSWTVGYGGVGSYGENGGGTENQRLAGTDPFGNSTIVWQSNPDGNGNADGGWNNGYYDIDRTKLYRWSVWVKRTSDTTSGNSYFGLYGSGGTWGIERLDGGGIETNPYWECVGTSAYAKNVWYLLVGHCYPAGTTAVPGNVNPDSGRYTVNGRDGNLNYCNIGGDVRWLADSTVGLHRAYHYYCGDTTTHLQWFDPRFEVCDGTQPTIQSLLSVPPTYTRSVIGTNKGELVNGTLWSTNNGGSFVFDGTNDYINIGSGTGINQFSGDFTISLWAMRTLGGSYGNLIGDYYTNNTATTGEWQLMMGPSSEFNFYKVGPGYIINNVSSGFSNNTWINVVVTRAGSAVTMYANTNIIGTGTDATSYGTITGNLNIGIDGNNSSEAFPGKIANINTYNRALTTNEIQQNYQQFKTRFNLS
jgi:hypothetical protein